MLTCGLILHNTSNSLVYIIMNKEVGTTLEPGKVVDGSTASLVEREKSVSCFVLETEDKKLTKVRRIRLCFFSFDRLGATIWVVCAVWQDRGELCGGGQNYLIAPPTGTLIRP